MLPIILRTVLIPFPQSNSSTFQAFSRCTFQAFPAPEDVRKRILVEQPALLTGISIIFMFNVGLPPKLGLNLIHGAMEGYEMLGFIILALPCNAL